MIHAMLYVVALLGRAYVSYCIVVGSCFAVILAPYVAVDLWNTHRFRIRGKLAIWLRQPNHRRRAG